jgi:hypothetical protein
MNNATIIILSMLAGIGILHLLTISGFLGGFVTG